MRSYRVPAAYRQRVLSAIANAVDEIARDMAKPGVLPEFMIDAGETGTATIVVDELPEACAAVTVDGVTLRPPSDLRVVGSRVVRIARVARAS